MRRIKKAFLSCAIVAAVALFASPPAMASGGGSCSTAWNVTANGLTNGPCAVNSRTNPVCLPAGTTGSYTAIEYKISGGTCNISNVAVLVTKNNYPAHLFLLGTGGINALAPGVGDTTTGLGKYSFHEVAVKASANAQTYNFWVIVSGQKQVRQTTLAVKANGSVKYYVVPGLGEDPPVPPAASVKETLTHVVPSGPNAGLTCSVEFTLASDNATVLSVQKLDTSTDPSCTLRVDNAADLSITIGNNVLPLKFGQGYFESGTSSCTTRIIGGKVYTWGDTCE